MKYIMQIIIACNGSFGVDCRYRCNINCINQMCDRFNGSCLYGCTEGGRCVEGIFFDYDKILKYAVYK